MFPTVIVRNGAQTDGDQVFEAGDTQSVAATGAEAAGEFGLEIGI